VAVAAGKTRVCPAGTGRRAGLNVSWDCDPTRSPDDQSVTDSLTWCFPPAHCAVSRRWLGRY